jgi:predicted nucleic acid-binding Zn ribbon protein
MLAVKPGVEASHPRQCLQCGKLIVHRRITALYCSGKCREIHNAHKRRRVRGDTKDVPSPACEPETSV